jgi:predicted transcriptional regulator
MISLLKELRINFIPQLNKINFKWCNNKRYDFYIYNIDNEGGSGIIECHGLQHYEEINRKGTRKLKEEQENDALKEKTAKENGINNYFIIDCRCSNMEFIKNSILNNEIMSFWKDKIKFINWNKIEEYARKSIVKLVCELKKDNPDFTAKDIANIVGINKLTVRNYLKQGTKIWDWINYNPEDEVIKNIKMNIKKNSIKVTQLTLDNKFIKHWDSITLAQNELGGKIHISDCCKNKPVRKTAGGFKWMYKEDYDKLQI